MNKNAYKGRQIKFRAWQKGHNKMFYKVNLYSLGGKGKMTKAQLDNRHVMDDIGLSCEIMQFTGLLDKNGKEIYEGDIIENQVYDEGDECNVIERRITRRVVKWQNGISNHLPHKNDNPSTASCNPQFVGELLEWYDDGSCYWSEFHNCDVVGNIYETPHLLNQPA